LLEIFRFNKEVSNHNISLKKLNGNSQIKKPKTELKVLPSHLKYVLLGESKSKLVITNRSLFEDEERRLIEVLKVNQEAISWTLSDLKGISSSYCIHKIHMEKDYKPIYSLASKAIESHKEIVKKELQKLFEARMI